MGKVKINHISRPQAHVIFVWLMDHEHMIHSLVVMVGHGRTLQGNYNFCELKLKVEACRRYIRNLRLSIGLWNA